MSGSTPLRRCTLLLAATLVLPRLAAATTANDICPPSADPCVLSRSLVLGPSSVLDFGARAFTIDGPGRLELVDDDVVTILAQDVTLEAGSGARIANTTGSEIGGTVLVEAMGDIVLRSIARPLGIDVSAQQAGGTIELNAGGSIVLGAELQAKGTTAASDGGFIAVNAAGTIQIANNIVLSGGADGIGGDLEIGAGDSIVATPRIIDVTGGFGGGTITIDAAGDLTCSARLHLAGTGLCADGGFLDITVGGHAALTGPIDGQATGTPLEGGCFGADVGISARGTLRVDGRVDVSGGAPDGEGGIVDFLAGIDMTLDAPVDAHGAGDLGFGGTVDLAAERRLALNAVIDVHGGSEGNAGSVFGFGAQEVHAASEINADRDRGQIALSTRTPGTSNVGGRVLVTGRIHSDGPTNGGDITLEGCAIDLPNGGEVAADGPGAVNRLLASGQMTIGGRLLAGIGTNVFRHRDAALPPVILGTASIVPSAFINVDESLPPCGPVCGNGIVEGSERCDEGAQNGMAGAGCTALCDAGVLCGPGTGPACIPCVADTDCAVRGRCQGFACVAGTCTPEPPLACDDGNPCTTDTCDPIAGCQTSPITGAAAGCDNGNACDGVETCNAGVCNPGSPPAIDDGDPCTIDGLCDPAVGVLRSPKTGLLSASCRFEAMAGLLARTGSDEITARLARALGRQTRKTLNRLERSVNAKAKKQAKALRVAAKRLRKLERLLGRGLRKGWISQPLVDQLLAQMQAASAAVSALQAGG